MIEMLRKLHKKSLWLATVVEGVGLLVIGGMVWGGAYLLLGGHHRGHSVWGYHGNIGPDRWDQLKPEFKICKSGASQSPINIPTRRSKVDSHLHIQFHYQQIPLQVTNNGHTIQVNVPKGSYVEFDGKAYELVQFHLHTPCEHQIDSKKYAGELHLVHRDQTGRLLVVGLFLDDHGTQNSFFSSIARCMPKHEGTANDWGVKLNLQDILPKNPHFYTYRGSLTTPNCAEGVRWVVIEQPVKLSHQQIEAFHNIMHDNARPIQSIHSRVIHTDH